MILFPCLARIRHPQWRCRFLGIFFCHGHLCRFRMLGRSFRVSRSIFSIHQFSCLPSFHLCLLVELSTLWALLRLLIVFLLWNSCNDTFNRWNRHTHGRKSQTLSCFWEWFIWMHGSLHLHFIYRLLSHWWFRRIFFIPCRYRWASFQEDHIRPPVYHGWRNRPSVSYFLTVIPV